MCGIWSPVMVIFGLTVKLVEMVGGSKGFLSLGCVPQEVIEIYSMDHEITM